MDAQQLKTGLEKVAGLGREVETHARIQYALRRYSEREGRMPNHIVVSQSTWWQLLAEAAVLTSGLSYTQNPKLVTLFGMTIEVAPISDDIFFVGEKRK